MLQGPGPIVLDDVQCTGLELFVTDCPNAGFYYHNCLHSEDAGVSCTSEWLLSLGKKKKNFHYFYNV